MLPPEIENFKCGLFLWVTTIIERLHQGINVKTAPHISMNMGETCITIQYLDLCVIASPDSAR